MLSAINVKETGLQIRRIMDKRGLSVKEVAKSLELGSVQSVYHWLNGISMPTIDNFYALSELLQVPIDTMICGNRKIHFSETKTILENKRIFVYYQKIKKIDVA